MTRDITVAALQLPIAASEAENIDAVSDLVSQASDLGAQIILPPELFSGPYFCKTQEEKHFALDKILLKRLILKDLSCNRSLGSITIRSS